MKEETISAIIVNSMRVLAIPALILIIVLDLIIKTNSHEKDII